MHFLEVGLVALHDSREEKRKKKAALAEAKDG